jgi:hypothetical protein
MKNKTTKKPALKVETFPLSSLELDPRNARRHPERNLESIKRSLKRFGQQKPIVVDGDGVIVAGNGTVAAAKALGWKTIDVVRTKLARRRRGRSRSPTTARGSWPSGTVRSLGLRAVQAASLLSSGGPGILTNQASGRCNAAMARNVLDDVFFMLETAIQFEWADITLQQVQKLNEEEFAKVMGRSRPALRTPAVVLSAFSLEIYLKALQQIERGSYDEGHSLDVLYGTLDVAHRSRIETLYDEWRNTPDGRDRPSLADALRQSSRAFVDWRYMFEEVGPNKPSASATYSARPVIIAVKQVIGEADPECKALMEHFARP